MSKVKLDTIKPWIGKKLTEVLDMEDDVVVDFVNNQLEAERVRWRICKGTSISNIPSSTKVNQ